MKLEISGNETLIGAKSGFEQTMWQAANKLRNNLDAAEYKHVVLGLMFLKFISDKFQETYKKIRKANKSSEDKSDFIKTSGFWLPPLARWEYLEENANEDIIGNLINDAMNLIERENPSLNGVLPGDYTRETLDKDQLGELIRLIGSIKFGDKEYRNRDVLGRVYEYFLGQFALAEGRKGGQFYTPPSVVRLLVEMIEPYKGSVFDPCCGSGGMFIQSERFIESHGGQLDDITVYGQESNKTTWRLCRMNLFIHGIIGDIQWGDSLNADAYVDLKADYILANPPFNAKEWKAKKPQYDKQWKYGIPPLRNANFAWVQHFISHMAPTGVAGFVLANGSLSSMTSNEGMIRKNVIEDDLIDCIVALPDRLFYNTGISACLWILDQDKGNVDYRDRRKQILFIDARNMGILVNKARRELSTDDIQKIVNTFQSWKYNKYDYQDILGFCKAVNISNIRKQQYILTPSRYVGITEESELDETFVEKISSLTKELEVQFKKSKILEDTILRNLGRLKHDF
ncbi:MAG: N-6 DNA methylase [Candidatus Hodarchaeota archaeon]